MNELWQYIPNWREYAISNYGQVKRIDDYLYHDDEGNEVYKEVKSYLASSGKPLVHVYGEHGHNNIDIAFMVCKLFNSEPLPKQRVLYKDKDKTNCRADNLYWGTFKEYADMFGIKPGRPIGSVKKRMGIEIARQIRQRSLEGVKQDTIAKEFNVAQTTISLIVNDKIWKE